MNVSRFCRLVENAASSDSSAVRASERSRRRNWRGSTGERVAVRTREDKRQRR